MCRVSVKVICTWIILLFIPMILPFIGYAQVNFTDIGAPLPHLVRSSLAWRVITLVDNEEKSAGRHFAIWDGRNLAGERVASGVYLYKLQTGTFTSYKKWSLLDKEEIGMTETELSNRIMAVIHVMVMMVAVLVCSTLEAQTELRITASDPSTNAQFGRSVEINGDFAAVGAWCDNIYGKRVACGIYIYQLRAGSSPCPQNALDHIAPDYTLRETS